LQQINKEIANLPCSLSIQSFIPSRFLMLAEIVTNRTELSVKVAVDSRVANPSVIPFSSPM
jgi:hypothetical protein